MHSAKKFIQRLRSLENTIDDRLHKVCHKEKNDEDGDLLEFAKVGHQAKLIQEQSLKKQLSKKITKKITPETATESLGSKPTEADDDLFDELQDGTLDSGLDGQIDVSLAKGGDKAKRPRNPARKLAQNFSLMVDQVQ